MLRGLEKNAAGGDEIYGPRARAWSYPLAAASHPALFRPFPTPFRDDVKTGCRLRKELEALRAQEEAQ